MTYEEFKNNVEMVAAKEYKTLSYRNEGLWFTLTITALMEVCSACGYKVSWSEEEPEKRIISLDWTVFNKDGALVAKYGALFDKARGRYISGSWYYPADEYEE